MAENRLFVHTPDGDQTLAPHPELAEVALTEVLRRHGLPLNTRCGERGHCDGCLIELVAGPLVRAGSGEVVVGNDHPRTLRACEHRIAPGATTSIRVPPRSLLAYEPQVVTEFRINVPRAHDPLWQQVEVTLPATGDGKAACEALLRLRESDLPVRLADGVGTSAGQRQHATLEYRGDHWLVSGLSASRTARDLGVAIDIGTTTVALLVVDLRTGHVLGKAAMFNQQMHLGDDVLTRINLCTSDPANLGKLQRAVALSTIAPLLSEALGQTAATPQDVRCIAVAGNTTMLHLLAGVDPTPMGVAPFTPPFIDYRALSWEAITSSESARTHGGPTVHLLPGAAAYVGADLTAGTLASGLLYDDGPSVLVDVGTNGEIILKHEGKLYGCATAAGPAFEGAGLSCGLRAGDGAVSHMQLSLRPLRIETEVIGQERGATPTGLCGSAYVDFLAEARRVSLLAPTGRFDTEAAQNMGATLVSHNGDLALRIAEGMGKRDILITQGDIASLLQAKAAIAAGLLTLLERRGLSPADVRTVYLAGGFGTHMVRSNAIGCGLLPGFGEKQIQPVGNTALAGALMALLDAGALGEISRAGRQMEIVELNLDPGFEDRYIDQLGLP